MNKLIRDIVLATVMLAASGAALALRPTHKIAAEGPAVDLERLVPAQFGDWRSEPMGSGQIINPQMKENLDRIYTQTLTRTYINSKGDHVMLSIAYGDDQSDAKALHYPEVCYPAQGFQVISNQSGVIRTDFGDIRVKKLLTVMGSRSEPLTYWTTVGNKVVVGSRETKLEQLKYGFHGQIPDGLLFRASSITQDAEEGYAIQQNFVRTLAASLSSENRLRLAGLAGQAH